MNHSAETTAETALRGAFFFHIFMFSLYPQATVLYWMIGSLLCLFYLILL